MKLSPQRVARCEREIKECHLKIAKEESYSPDLRNVARIKELYAHIEHVKGLMVRGVNTGQLNLGANV